MLDFAPRTVQRVSLVKLLAATGVGPVLLVAIRVLNAPAIQAQAPPTHPAIEVATIKLNTSGGSAGHAHEPRKTYRKQHPSANSYPERL
jgi:hypothetical protein